MGGEQRLRPGMKTAFGLDLQKAGAVRLRTIPALAFACVKTQLSGRQTAQRRSRMPAAVKMIADFLPDQFRGVGQRRKRQRRRQTAWRTCSVPLLRRRDDDFQPVAVQGDAQDGRGAFAI